MKKKMLAIALIASLTAGSALCARKDTAKPAPKQQWYTRQTIKPVTPITDPKALNKQIRDINKQVRKMVSKRNRYINDRTRAANDGDQKLVEELTNKIRYKNAEIVKQIALIRMYTLRLVTIKAKDIKKEKPKKEKRVRAKKEKTKREEPEKSKRYE
jgi:hypothetical protein